MAGKDWKWPGMSEDVQGWPGMAGKGWGRPNIKNNFENAKRLFENLAIFIVELRSNPRLTLCEVTKARSACAP